MAKMVIFRLEIIKVSKNIPSLLSAKNCVVVQSSGHEGTNVCVCRLEKGSTLRISAAASEGRPIQDSRPAARPLLKKVGLLPELPPSFQAIPDKMH